MKKAIIILITVIFIGCQSDRNKDVGDISFDVQRDNRDFSPCSESRIKQYYVRHSSDTPPNYKGEKRGLENEILSQYTFPVTTSQNGYVTIRFIVNCKGESGRFRIEEMDSNYQPFKFDINITDQLLDIVRSLKGWIPRKRKEKNYDFYQYLTFKIESGQITKILP